MEFCEFCREIPKGLLSYISYDKHDAHHYDRACDPYDTDHSDDAGDIDDRSDPDCVTSFPPQKNHERYVVKRGSFRDTASNCGLCDLIYPLIDLGGGVTKTTGTESYL